MDDLIERVAQRIAAIPGLPASVRLADAALAPLSDTPISGYIDHTLLKPEATPEQIAQICAEAIQYRFASVCVNPSFVPLCASLLAGTPVAVCTVIGFPLGATTTKTKVFEANQAAVNGARELDMVIAVGQLKAGRYPEVAEDIRQVVDAGHAQRALVKVIIETALLSDEEKVAACLLAKRAGADFVKTSTGFSGGGATAADIALMRRAVGPDVGVKASGGVRCLADAQVMIAAGASRIGASAGVAIVREAEGGAATPRGTGY
ncbi:deoxyribose-phosphate aldolase [Chloroflexales bacterium ZM16-3]|nr:deoxyribose-phosphate aldolase [Chloroflexales bacterium ZM16-3]